MVDFEGALRTSATGMIKLHFDAYFDIVDKKPEVAAATPSVQGFRDFVTLFAEEIQAYPYWSSTQHGAELGRAILDHPLWQKLRECAGEEFPTLPQRDIHALRTRMAQLEAFKAGIPAQEALLLSQREMDAEPMGGREQLPFSRSTSVVPHPPGTGRIGSGSPSTALSIHTQVTRHSSRQGTHGSHSHVPSPRTPGSAGPQPQHGFGLRSWEGASALEAQSEGVTELLVAPAMSSDTYATGPATHSLPPPAFPSVVLPPRSPTSPLLASSPFRAPPSLTAPGPSPMRMPSIAVISPMLDSQDMISEPPLAQESQTSDTFNFNFTDEDGGPERGAKEPDSAVYFGETTMKPSPPSWTPVAEEDPAGGGALKGSDGVTPSS